MNWDVMAEHRHNTVKLFPFNWLSHMNWDPSDHQQLMDQFKVSIQLVVPHELGQEIKSGRAVGFAFPFNWLSHMNWDVLAALTPGERVLFPFNWLSHMNWDPKVLFLMPSYSLFPFNWLSHMNWDPKTRELQHTRKEVSIQLVVPHELGPLVPLDFGLD